ncbi:hypothetical protein HHE02_02750 [Helicobacter heilmannii]|nr:hypothetical protein HHE014_16220 [Helicobacter heilmannii]CRF46992.1 hypothetical protein HHE02_02750 [Helicobacter heilmannii]CRF49740.1 hypothetical protein HHE03_14060 [Helicobacter heilmannii]CRF51724.1 hypothetical protein HHE06_16220 [Helicobacter heilmannii]
MSLCSVYPHIQTALLFHILKFSSFGYILYLQVLNDYQFKLVRKSACDFVGSILLLRFRFSKNGI